MEPVIFSTDELLGMAAAERIFTGIKTTYQQGKKYVLGCPGGRSPRSTFKALAQLIATNQQPLTHLTIAMMDEFAVESPAGEFSNVSEDSHFSCKRFAFKEIRDVLDAGIPQELHIPHEQVLVPDARNPQAYEDLLRGIGIDCFLLASGTSDGHVAFNPIGTDQNEVTRIARLAKETRTDNLQTFPDFADISEVPKFGVTVGPGTISAVSKSAIMLLQGAHKRLAFTRISAATHFESDWPATIIADCNNPLLFADSEAAGLA